MLVPIRKLKIAAAILLAWTVLGLLLAKQLDLLSSPANPATRWPQSLILELAYCYVWACFTPLVLALGRLLRLENSNWIRRVPVHMLASISFAAAAQIASIQILGRFHFSWYPAPPLQTLSRSILSTLDYGSILYWVVLLIGQSFEYVARYNVAQAQKSELQAQLAQAQLDALKTQLHPHFLFNALNSLSELIHEDPETADRLVTRLSELLRFFLQGAESQEVSLEQEIQFSKRFLEIQKIRFEERLSFKITLDPATVGAFVPSLILQPLIENAVRHGIANREENGLIELESSLQSGQLCLRIADNGDGNGSRLSAVIPEGTGLRSTRQRLRSIYGDHQAFHLDALSGGGTQAIILIPFRAGSNGMQHVQDKNADCR